MSGRPAVTVVFAVLNHRATLPALLQALEQTDWPGLRTIAVDCGSTDGSRELLQRHAANAPRVPLQLLDRAGRGRATALAVAMDRAGTDDVVRLHADVVPDAADWLQRLWQVLATHPDCGIVGGRIALAGGRLQSCGRRLISGLGIAPEWSDLGWMEAWRDQPSLPHEVDGAAGELCWIRRAVLTATGGLDTDYDPVFGDDDDLCLLARWHGFSVLVEPAVCGVHHAPHWTQITPDGVPEPTGLVQRQRQEQDQLRRCHRDYFRRKWGFDPEAPDLHEVRRRYGHTRICWQIGDRLREDLPPQPAVDVCFVTWNSRGVLPRMLDQLAATRWPALRVFVTDNGSTDDTVDYLRERAATFPFPLLVETLPLNVGVAQALNLAFRRGQAPLVARLDDDVFVPPDWLELLVPNFHQRPFAGVVGPRMLNANAGASLQNGPSRGWPGPLPGTGPGDAERVRGKARVNVICGCCNLYRRSVFTHAGRLDIRFSPSQFDEVDHHVALHVAGFEAIYDGRVTVHHQRNAGRGETPAALGNFAGNQQKHATKWGGRQWLVIDRAIDLSVDGRFLPVDGDTRSLWAALPPVPAGPPPRPGRDPAEVRHWLAVARRHSLLRAQDGPLSAWWQNQILLAEQALDRDDPIAAALIVRLRDLLPHDPRALQAVARWQHRDGEHELAARTARLAQRLAPEDADLAARCRTWRDAPTAAAAHSVGTVTIPRPAAPPPSVVLLAPMHRHEASSRLVETTAAALAAIGVTCRIERDLVPAVHGASVVHAFGDERGTLLGRLQCARAMLPHGKLVLSPLQIDRGRAEWTKQVLNGSYFAAPAAVRQLCAAVVAGAVDVGGHRDRRLPAADADAAIYAARTRAFVDALVVFAPAEVDWQVAAGAAAASIVLLPEGLAPAPAVAPAPSIRRGSVLMLGPRDLADQHLLTVLALADSDLPLALAGDAAFPYGDWHLQRLVGPRLSLLPAPTDDTERQRLLRAAAVSVWLPSAPMSFQVPLQAAVAGCELVLAQGVGAEAVFGPHATYVDPFDLPALRGAVVAAAARWTADRQSCWRRQLAARHELREFGTRLMAAYGFRADSTPGTAPGDAMAPIADGGPAPAFA